jgi:NADH-quinone oxidoreductase subunit F
LNEIQQDRGQTIESIVIGFGSCGIAAGAREIYDFFNEQLSQKSLPYPLKKTGCNGMCYREVLIEVRNLDGSKTLYGDIDKKRAAKILDEHIIGGRVITDWSLLDGDSKADSTELLQHQERIVLRNCGIIDPESLEDYERHGGYASIRRILTSGEFTPDKVISAVTISGLRGRGGAGFPTGMKWSFARKASGATKYIICNADEGDPGAFMDRSVLESDPHSVLEGMLIASYAIGAQHGYIYVRAEYPLAIKRLIIAIDQMRAKGYLGDNIMGSGHSFDLKIKEGAGAFVCGEETALMQSIEGKRGMPRVRPPFPATSGLWQSPTNINNVETYANLPWIFSHGAEKYAAFGTEKSKGTKVFALAGKIKRGGLVEVPMGITIEEIVNVVGGGSSTKHKIKAVQMGGPSGGCIPHWLFSTRIDYDEVNRTGAIMGSGGMVVLDESTCMVDMAKFFLQFTQNESCGKCTFCRIGTKRMLEILIRISEGKGQPSDIDLLEELAQNIKTASLCGLGQTAPNPVLTTLKYFREEYEAHIHQKRCPAGKCKSLISYRITPACTGCTLCARNCPTAAISGEKKQLHLIDQEKCIRCGICIDNCKFDAIFVE